MYLMILLTLISLHLAPFTLQEKLVMNYQEFSFSNPGDWIRLYTTHFVHVNFGHLLGNLIIFIVIFPTLYFLAEAGKDVGLFKRFLVFVFLILPPILSIVDLLVMRRYDLRYGMGFSGIDSALIGAVPYFSSNMLSRKFNFKLPPLMFSNSFMLITGGLISIIYSIFVIGIPLLIGGILLLVYTVSKAFREYDWNSLGKEAQKRKVVIRNFILAISLLIVGAIWAAFPRNLLGEAGLVNIFIHYLGLVSTLYLFPVIEELHTKNLIKRS
ncbi:MAG TPA: rhomboid family intramembrane serine protease [Thermococcaceae archaeon]|nr:rhomboid family intramembrane serine protease [Thermococcus sp.]HII66706.1 rhomboid family intramembrane serine protease [Thermococcaceae archaeon]